MQNKSNNIYFVAKCLSWTLAANKVEELKKIKVLNESCYKAIEEATKSTTKGQKTQCLEKFIGEKFTYLKYFFLIESFPPSDCKQAQDRAIALINACNMEETIIMGNTRAILNEIEDMEDEDYDDEYGGEFDWLHDFDNVNDEFISQLD